MEEHWLRYCSGRLKPNKGGWSANYYHIVTTAPVANPAPIVSIPPIYNFRMNTYCKVHSQQHCLFHTNTFTHTYTHSHTHIFIHIQAVTHIAHLVNAHTPHIPQTHMHTHIYTHTHSHPSSQAYVHLHAQSDAQTHPNIPTCTIVHNQNSLPPRLPIHSQVNARTIASANKVTHVQTMNRQWLRTHTLSYATTITYILNTCTHAPPIHTSKYTHNVHIRMHAFWHAYQHIYTHTGRPILQHTHAYTHIQLKYFPILTQTYISTHIHGCTNLCTHTHTGC